MTNLDIETFWAVVQHGTMTAAAEALYHHPAHAVPPHEGALRMRSGAGAQGRKMELLFAQL